MKDLHRFNVEKLNKKELLLTSGGGLGVWFAKALDAIEGAVYDLFAGQANHVRKKMQQYR